jgi:hypothetical protein
VPIHPGARNAVARLGLDELGIARAMAAGELPSPQRYLNLWLFDMRVTGTGLAYRTAHDEYAWRDPSIYLNDEFLARCQGLPLIWEHPQGQVLSTEEYRDRAVGAVMLPYIKGDDVWAIVRVHDDEAARAMLEGKLSTSPSVVLRDEDNETRKLSGGSSLLIEGKPRLLDHLAVCEQGVWDKGGEPSGINNAGAGETEMAADDKRDDKRRDDADAGEKLDEILEHLKLANDARKDDRARLDALHRRMDAYDDADRRRRADDKSLRFQDDDDDDAFKKRMDAEEEEDKKQLEEGGAKWRADKVRFRDDRRKARDDAAKAKDDKAKDDDGNLTIHHKAKDDKAKDDQAIPDPTEKEPITTASDKAKDDKAKDDKMRDDASFADRITKAVDDALKLKGPKADSEETRAAKADAQARADAAYQAFGTRAPAPLVGETLRDYRLRLLRDHQAHSARWKGVDLRALLDDAALKNVEGDIYADAIVASRSPTDLSPGQLREVVKTDPVTGQRTIEFVGPQTIFASLSAPVRAVTRFNLDKRGA